MSVPFHGGGGGPRCPVAPPASLPMSSLLPPAACLPVLASGLSLERASPGSFVPSVGSSG